MVTSIIRTQDILSQSSLFPALFISQSISLLELMGHPANNNGTRDSNDAQVKQQIEVRVIERGRPELEERECGHPEEIGKMSNLILLLI